MVKVFSKNNCMQCKMVKRFLDERGVAFVEHNIDEEPEYINYLKEKGFQAVPVVETKETTFSGFRPDQLKALSV
ncbi:ribonucleoside-diphosphate reductase class Ib glutaredoxin subunit [Pilibacter termitis]|uniref:Glutaredoxin-like protein NrdH n=1 Tax=Pilibacter termitis TaxID=263852 RepID=A0A1T4KMG4_9ENTE|nr:glutaredoxin-like protein NrdH [Pilibacter termitis]SJZ43596.1 ribonucleoside-diphosphate reductase class Ib glutaredoxin subunit [Pilibacter termitis]